MLAAVSAPVLLILLQPALQILTRNPEYFLHDVKVTLPFVQMAALYIFSGLLLALLRNKSKACAVGLCLSADCAAVDGVSPGRRSTA